MICRSCGYSGHRDLSAAASIAARAPGGGTTPAIPAMAGLTHRRTGTHLPGVHPARRDPRRRANHRGRPGPLAGTGPPSRTPTRERQDVARLTTRTRKPTGPPMDLR
jgi:hypothetical protein